MQDHQSHYDILGVPKDATAAEIRREFLRKAHQFHPDLNPGSEALDEQFKRIRQAYEILGDPRKRGAHDRSLELQEAFANRDPNASPFSLHRLRDSIGFREKLGVTVCGIAAIAILALFIRFSISERSNESSPTLTPISASPPIKVPTRLAPVARQTIPDDDINDILAKAEKKDADVRRTEEAASNSESSFWLDSTGSSMNMTLPTYPDTTTHTSFDLDSKSTSDDSSVLKSFTSEPGDGALGFPEIPLSDYPVGSSPSSIDGVGVGHSIPVLPSPPQALRLTEPSTPQPWHRPPPLNLSRAPSQAELVGSEIGMVGTFSSMVQRTPVMQRPLPPIGSNDFMSPSVLTSLSAPASPPSKNLYGRGGYGQPPSAFQSTPTGSGASGQQTLSGYGRNRYLNNRDSAPIRRSTISRRGF